jgi:hypothetical protein
MEASMVMSTRGGGKGEEGEDDKNRTEQHGGQW